MAHERLNLPAASGEVHAGGVTDGVIGRPVIVDVGDDGSKTPRLPRWTRQEILVLIQGKKVAENRVRRGRTAGLAFGSNQVEPKWASVSSYCKRHGVNRGPVQCRKRWSNLAGDYKKIKEWESQIKDEADSFWVMRNDLRRERKLPGFFDREVYDILDGGDSDTAVALALALVPTAEETEEDVKQAVEVGTTEAVFDSGRSAAAEDGLFSDEEFAGATSETKEFGSTSIAAPVPISEQQYQPYARGDSSAQVKAENVNPVENQQPGSRLKRKRRRRGGGEEEIEEVEEEEEKEERVEEEGLIQVMEKNGRMLNAQLEAHNTNLQLDREQRHDHAGTLVSVLNKLADALVRIADKL